jgi:tRNA modification GTPase
MDDTIVAISTSMGVGAISIIRLSGSNSINVINKIFSTNLTNAKSHTIHYGYIIENNNKVDEVLVTVMRSPKTYTKEDIIEINTHGGISTTHKVLELCLKNGARLAEPGEFTKRAFLNGRIDLTEAEAVSDLINSNSDASRNLALNQLTGSLSNLVKEIRNTLVKLMSNIEVNIDYPEYNDIENVTIPLLKKKLQPIKEQLLKLIAESNNSKLIQDGINIALIGRPNVGKSSLLNKLLDEDKAIVTNIPGTTRDIVEGSVILQGLKINFIDTAGIRKTNDVIENIGVNKSINELNTADLIILILNNNEQLSKDDEQLLSLLENKNYIIYINKNDLPTKLDLSSKYSNLVYGNTIKPDGIEPLKDKILELFSLEKINVKDQTYLTNARQKSLAEQALNQINEAIDSLNNNIPVDLIEVNLKECFDTLGEIIGVTYKDELIDEMFSHFCLGK